MKHHIVRVVAVVTAVLMLLSIVPAAALQELSLPNLMSVVTGSTEDGLASGGNASLNADPTGNTMQNTGAPSEGDDPIGGDSIVDDEDYDFADDVVLGKDYSTFVGPTLNADSKSVQTTADGRVDKTLSPYEPYKTELEEHPFLPDGTAWIDLENIYYGAPATQNFPLTKWSANTSVYNITETGKVYTTGAAAGEKEYLFPDKDMIDGYLWAGYAEDARLKVPEYNADGSFVLDAQNKIVYTDVQEHGVVSSNSVYHDAPVLTAKNGNVAYAYNRYDAMQGKYGITFDRNVKSAVWEPSWKPNYYGNTPDDLYRQDLNQMVVYLSDTPYLYFSTEGPDTTKIAISLLIGSPVQEELKRSNQSNGQTYVKNTKYYEYRWYTITDNAERPGVSLDSRDNSMIPNITVSDVVATIEGLNADETFGSNAYHQQEGDVVRAVDNAGKGDPLALAVEKGISRESLFVDGAITGCLDFTNILPVIMSNDADNNGTHGGRENVQYKVARIRVDTETAPAKEGEAENADSAFRLNYLYFGPSLVTTFSPQNMVGSEIDGQAWQFTQTASGIGKEDDGTGVGAWIEAKNTSPEAAYTSGWENGAAVSLKNTPNDPQLITVDIHGQGDGELIEWSEAQAMTGVKIPLRGSQEESKVWKFTDKNGNVQLLEAECNEDNGSYYVMVSVPVRKWINVLSESRKISANVTLLNKGKDKHSVTGEELLPTFTFWGNEAGALGPGHGGFGDDGLGARFRNEDLILVVAPKGQIYHCDEGDNYYAAEVDRTIGDSLMYNAPGGTNETWLDVLRSPYTYEQTVTGANKDHHITNKHIGYTYITTLRFAMPIDSAISVQNLRGDGNSAGLNTYSTSGTIVSAFDGGTGVQPEIDMTKDNVETQFRSEPVKEDGYFVYYDSPKDHRYDEGETKYYVTKKDPNDVFSKVQAVYKKNADGSYVADATTLANWDTLGLKPMFTYPESGYSDGNIKGTQNPGSAAYGPFLRESYYTIYDMLDTERMNESGKDAHASSNKGRDYQTVYGEAWQMREKRPIFAYPSSDSTFQGKNNPVYAYTYSDGDIIIYATVRFYDRQETWGLTGVVTSGGTPEMGWVKLWSEAGGSYGTSKGGGARVSEGYIPNSADFDSYNFPRGGINFNYQWVLSNFNTSLGDFLGTDKNASGTKLTGGKTRPKDVYSSTYSPYNHGPVLSYANMWRGGYGTNESKQLQDFTIRAVNGGTDLELQMKRKNNTANHWSVGMSRIFDAPIPVHQGKNWIHSEYPVFYYDYTTEAIVADGNDSNSIGLSVRVDTNGDDKVDTDYLYRLALEGSSAPRTLKNNSGDGGGGTGGSVYGYASLEGLMNEMWDLYGNNKYLNDAKTVKRYPKIDIVGLSFLFWRASDANISSDKITIRRMEIWQEETDYLDEINATIPDASKPYDLKVYDSMNIVNDAFFHYHNEDADGNFSYAEVKNDDGTQKTLNLSGKINSQLPGGYKFTESQSEIGNTNTFEWWDGKQTWNFDVSNSYRKTNSNKGWSAYIRTDTNDDGIIDGKDSTVNSYEGYEKDGVYEYRTSLGHLRVWVPADANASVVFESDRSFNTDNYRYLYYSYSMRDTDTGISAEEPSTARNDGLRPGISLAIKSQQNTSDRAYLETDGSWAYYPDGEEYWSERGVDNREFYTTRNAAVDLSTMEGIDSINQFVFYLNNPLDKEAQFYINYIHLSNQPPEQHIQTAHEEIQKQYYYMMDNTGDRYSARFPTIDNPTGQVSGLNADNDRVNPIVVDRGARLSDGKYFNGDPIYTYGKDANGNVITGSRDEFDDTTASNGYYEKTYGAADGMTGSMKNILFYAGESEDENDINDIQDYYVYSDTNGDGEKTIYDMYWSYGRWYTGAGESGLNTMYIGDPNNLGPNDTADQISGNLTRRYATENYVLLRAGIEPKEFLTYFDAKGGQILYNMGTSQQLKDGVFQNLNNYYIDQNAVFSYFKTPRINTVDLSKNVPTKFGYVFDGWYRDDDASGDSATSANRLYKYTKKEEPVLNYFFATWKPAYELEPTDERYEDFYMPADTEYTVTFLRPGTTTGETWYTRKANYQNTPNAFQQQLPETLRVTVGGNQKHVVGWKVAGSTSGDVYMPGASVTITSDVTFEAVLQDISNATDAELFTHSVTVPDNVELKLFRDQVDANGNPIYGDPATLKIQTLEGAGTVTYVNIPHGVVVVLLPKDGAATNHGWTMNVKAAANATEKNEKVVCSTDSDVYQFSVLSDVEIDYEDISNLVNMESVSTEARIFTTAADTTSDGKTTTAREMKFYSQFSLPENAELVCYGTLYTKSGKNYDAIKAALDANMRLKESTITSSTISKGSFETLTTAVRQVKATDGAANKSNQYYFMVTENKGQAVIYYARGYVVYTMDGGATYKVAYSDTVARSAVDALTKSADEV